MHPKAIYTKVFVAFINKIEVKLGGGDFAMFLDNLSVQKTKDAKHFFEKLNFTEIFNMPYSPQFNGIEIYFLLLKATYNKLLLKFLINDDLFESICQTKQSIRSISNKNAKTCVRYAFA